MNYCPELLILLKGRGIYYLFEGTSCLVGGISYAEAEFEGHSAGISGGTKCYRNWIICYWSSSLVVGLLMAEHPYQLPCLASQPVLALQGGRRFRS